VCDGWAIEVAAQARLQATISSNDAGHVIINQTLLRVCWTSQCTCTTISTSHAGCRAVVLLLVQQVFICLQVLLCVSQFT
jgi:hypothetical protein